MKIITQRATQSVVYRFATNASSMKRTRAVTKVKANGQVAACDTTVAEKDGSTLQTQAKTTTKETENAQEKPKLNFKSLKGRSKKIEVVSRVKNKNRAVVDLDMMKEELKQLEDPPLTDWEKSICSSRLQYSFYDTPCEQLAQNLLGKILVRCLENGTVLKGRIVETEGYLGVIDKASHTYNNKVTPRNIPMYMPPGTIYVYMTYGMYHCFNISSHESGACVIMKSVEPLIGLDYMELLRNMRYEKNVKEKRIVENVKSIKYHELCNDPSKICTAFVIDEESFNQKKIYDCNDLWIENDPYITSTTIVPACPTTELSYYMQKVWRYYILGSTSVNCRDIEREQQAYKILGDGCAVLIRALDPLEGIECMANHRSTKGISNAKKISKKLKTHELCNGPSKLCIALQLQKEHSKYSICSWKGLWIENNTMEEDIKIVKSSRIGIENYGEEWTNKLLRYYIYGNKSVSKRDKKAEALLKAD